MSIKIKKSVLFFCSLSDIRLNDRISQNFVHENWSKERFTIVQRVFLYSCIPLYYCVVESVWEDSYEKSNCELSVVKYFLPPPVQFFLLATEVVCDFPNTENISLFPFCLLKSNTSSKGTRTRHHIFWI